MSAWTIIKCSYGSFLYLCVCVCVHMHSCIHVHTTEHVLCLYGVVDRSDVRLQYGSTTWLYMRESGGTVL